MMMFTLEQVVFILAAAFIGVYALKDIVKDC